MKILTGNEASKSASPFAKHMLVGGYKTGKTCFTIGSILGCLPWQKSGGIIDRPENLHVIATDADTVVGVPEFLEKSCGAPKEALNFNLYNIEDDVRAAWETEGGYDATLFGLVLSLFGKIQEQTQKRPGVHAVVVSSVTQLAMGMERAVVGSPDGRGYSDQNKWKIVSSRMLEVMNIGQRDYWHCFWEGHSDRAPDGNGGWKENMLISGKAGRLWGGNVGSVFAVRQINEKFNNTKVNKVYLDTKPSPEFVANGRGHNELLEAKEPDLAVVLRKLGKKVGEWNKKESK